MAKRQVADIFYGAGFCPFCATERWAIDSALSNFTSWKGLLQTADADHDEKYLNIPNVSFAAAAAAKYTSDYVEFVACETADRHFQPPQELDKKSTKF
jgi:hypothetical protein